VDALKEDGFYGTYTLSPKEPVICHRTQAVLRLLVLENRRYSSFVSGDDDGSKEQRHVNNHLAGVLTKYSREVMEMLEEVEHSGAAIEQRDVLVKRWKQIRDLVNVAIAALQS
jgi:hypothetical protein